MTGRERGGEGDGRGRRDRGIEGRMAWEREGWEGGLGEGKGVGGGIGEGRGKRVW